MKSSGILLRYKNEILLVFEQRKNKNVWNIPGGKRDHGESVQECAIREFYEETQLYFEFGDLPPYQHIDKYYAVFIVDVDTKPDISNFKPNNIQLDCKWVNIYSKFEAHYLLQRALPILKTPTVPIFDTPVVEPVAELVRVKKKRRFTRVESDYVEMYDGRIVDLLLKLTQSNHQNVPKWLTNPKNKHRIQLQLEFLAQIPRQDGVIYQRFQYQQANDENGVFGSKYPQNRCNYQQMKREVRSCLAAAYYDDADMDNAHFRLLLDDCEHRGIACIKIRDYVENRGLILKRLMEMHGITRDVAKAAFISVLYARENGNPYNAFLADKHLQYNNDSAALVNDLFAEAKSIRKQILEQEVAQGINWDERTNKDHPGARFAVYMQTKCAEALDFMVQCIRNQGFSVDSLIHDGCHVRKIDGKVLDIVSLNDAFTIKYKNGRLKIKAFETTVSEEFDNIQPYRHEFNNILLKSPPLSRDEIIPEDQPRFRNQNEYLIWQMEVVSRLNMNLAYITSKCEFMVKTGCEEYESKRTRFEALDYFADYNVNPIVCNKSVGKVNIFNIWRESTYRLRYNKKVCNPRPLNHLDAAKTNEFNVFKGFALSYDVVKNDEGDPGMFVDHITRIWCQENKKLAKCVLQFFAQMLQTPWVRVDWGLYLRGEQGSMKNFVLDTWIKKIMGLHTCFVTHDPNRIFGKFNKHLEGKILVGNDEAVSTYDKKAMSQLKGFTTSTTIMIEDKNVSQYEVIALHRLLTFSNEPEYANVGKGQRRGLFLETDDVYADVNCPEGSEAANNRKAYIDACLGCLPQTVAKYLYELDIGDFNARKVIHTKFEQQQIEGNLTPVESFALGIIRGDVCFTTASFEYELSTPISKDVIFESFRSQNSARTRHYGTPKFWKEFRSVFPSVQNVKFNRISSIIFTSGGLDVLKSDFRNCVKNQNWVF
jgi:8-oxo-dGTP diphosphatase